LLQLLASSQLMIKRDNLCPSATTLCTDGEAQILKDVFLFHLCLKSDPVLHDLQRCNLQSETKRKTIRLFLAIVDFRVQDQQRGSMSMLKRVLPQS
jgi:hypothetical protein